MGTPAQTHGGMRGDLDPTLYDITEDEWSFFSAWTKIQDPDAFRTLALDVQKRTYAIVSHVRLGLSDRADDSPASTHSPSFTQRRRPETGTPRRSGSRTSPIPFSSTSAASVREP